MTGWHAKANGISDIMNQRPQPIRRAPPLPEHLIFDLEPGLHSDGANLYLRVQESGSRAWVFIRYEGRRRREYGLGGARRVSLPEARQAAARLHQGAV